MVFDKVLSFIIDGELQVSTSESDAHSVVPKHFLRNKKIIYIGQSKAYKTIPHCKLHPEKSLLESLLFSGNGFINEGTDKNRIFKT